MLIRKKVSGFHDVIRQTDSEVEILTYQQYKLTDTKPTTIYPHQ